ncbi:MAG: ferric uptake regulator [Methanosaeta sp. PtaU1.Bin060]|jgi:Fur family peroxide stress response transcriptional regulator|nr:MAG: ferric uptake regulator [Methanosaeta sp. PtaU1.Bin060]
MASPQDLDSTIIKALRGKGYKATPQRIAICRFTLYSHEHPTAQRIYSEVKKTYPTVSLATVYNTIQILKDIGLLQEVSLSRDETRFDPNMEPHAHLVCLRCNSIADWASPLISETMKSVAIEAGFMPKGQNFDIFGLCRNCQKSEIAAASAARREQSAST